MSTSQTKGILVRDVMMPLDRFPVIGRMTMLKDALETMGQMRLGIACIVDEDNKLIGILTDGDIRRQLLKVQKPLSAMFVDDAFDHAIRTPVTTRLNDTLRDAVIIMEEKQVWDLPVVDEQGVLVGLLHLHSAVQALLGLNT